MQETLTREKTAPSNRGFKDVLNKLPNLSGFMISRIGESFHPGTGLYNIFKLIQPFIDVIVKKYIPDFHQDHPAINAVRYAAILVLYNSIDNIPHDITPNEQIKIKGDLDIYAINITQFIFTSDMKIQHWFRKHLSDEMLIRIKIIKATPNNNQYDYFPILENWRFVDDKSFIIKNGGEIRNIKIDRCLPIFKGGLFTEEEKNMVVERVVFNIKDMVDLLRQIDTNKTSFSYWELRQLNMIKDSFQNFMLEVLTPLRDGAYCENEYLLYFYRTIIEAEKEEPHGFVMSKYNDDINQTIDCETIDAMYKYKGGEHNRFFGCMKYEIRNRVKKSLWVKEYDRLASLPENVFVEPLTPMVESDRTYIDYLPPATYREIIQDEYTDQEKLSEVIEGALKHLTTKQRSVIEKAFFKNGVLTLTEVRQKNRTLKHIERRSGYKIKKVLFVGDCCPKCSGKLYECRDYISVGFNPVKEIIIKLLCSDCKWKKVKILENNSVGYFIVLVILR